MPRFLTQVSEQVRPVTAKVRKRSRLQGEVSLQCDEYEAPTEYQREDNPVGS